MLHLELKKGGTGMRGQLSHPARLRKGLGFAVAMTIVMAAACGSDDDDDGDAAETSATSEVTSALPAGGTDITPPVSSSAGSQPEGEATSGGILDVSVSADASSLDPQTGPAGTDHIILYPLFDTLITFEQATLEPRPGLAKEWEFVSPTQLRLHLVDGVRFHDGTPMDAAAVKASLDRYKEVGAPADLASVDSIVVIDPLTIDLIMNRPDSSLVLVLADRAGMIISAAAAEAAGEEFSRRPVGTGPYTFVEWRDGDAITLTKNEDYWQEGKPYLDGIVFRVMTDRQTAANALLTGDVDFADQLDKAGLGQLEASDDIEVNADPTVLVRMIYLNSSKEPLDDPLVRRAINHAIDRDGIVAATQAGLGEVAGLPVPQDHWAYDDSDAPVWPYDPELSKQLLTEAGLPDGFSIDVVLSNDPSIVLVGEAIQSQLAEVGIQYNITAMDWTQGITEYYEKQNFDAAQHSWTGRPDPGQTYARLFSPEGFENPGGLEIPGIVEAMAAATAVDDQAERAAQYAEVNDLVNEAAPWVPLYFNANLTGYGDDVRGYEPSLLGKPQVAFLQLAAGE